MLKKVKLDEATGMTLGYDVDKMVLANLEDLASAGDTSSGRKLTDNSRCKRAQFY